MIHLPATWEPAQAACPVAARWFDGSTGRGGSGGADGSEVFGTAGTTGTDGSTEKTGRNLDFKDDFGADIDVLFPLVGWLIEGFVYPFNNR